MTNDHLPLAECRSNLKQRLDDCFTRRDDPTKCFARNGVAREILDQQTLLHLLKLIIYPADNRFDDEDEKRLRSLAIEIRGPETESSPGYCNTLAILLYARCSDECLITWAKTLFRHVSDGTQQRPINDHDLPLTEQEILDSFGHRDVHSFWEQQFLFNPVTLKEFDESIYDGHKQFCRLPFGQERVKIGKGAYAVVYRVKIEKGHLINETSGSGLQNSKFYAQKEFIDYDAEAKKAFEAEGSTIKKFIQATKSHENILVTKASLEWGGTYSLFFDLAKYSLWDYFKDPSISITTLEQKQRVFGRTIGLAGALAYLHDELFVASTGEQLCCYHLDLKPHNILVFEDRDNSVTWKVSDFGISQIKRIPASRTSLEPDDRTSFLNKVFKPDVSGADPSSGVANPRDAGTYTAPEARHKTKRVTRASDVWSLGCVITLVLSFLENQRTGIEEFGDARMKDREDDLFYDSFSNRFGTESKPSLRPSVPVWLTKLTENAKRRNSSEGEALRLASNLVRRQMLLPDPIGRSSAKNVEQELRSIHSCFAGAQTTSLAQSQQPLMIAKPLLNTSRLSRLKRVVHGHRSELKSFEFWHFRLPESTRGCKFSHDGRYLGMDSGNTITTLDTSEIRHGTPGVVHASGTEEQWSDFSLGSQYLCAAVDAPYFQCYYAQLSNTGPLFPLFINPGVKSRICKIAVSPDDKITAFVFEEPRQGKDILKVALYHTEDVRGSSSAQSEPRSTRHSSSSTTKSLTAGGLSEALPWNNIITDPEDRELPTACQLHHLKFSGDGKVLMVVTRPYKSEPTRAYHYDIFIWNVLKGRMVFNYTNKNPGFYDMESSWKIGSVALFANHSSFAAVSSKEIRIVSYKAGRRHDSRSRSTSDEVLDVVASEEGDEIILIGRSNSRGRIKAFRLQKSKVNGSGSVGKGVHTGMGDYDPMTDCCCLFREAGYGKQVLLIAKVKGRKNEGKLSFCYLE